MSDLMIFHGLSMPAIARAAGLTTSTLNAIATKTRSCSEDQRRAICQAGGLMNPRLLDVRLRTVKR